MSKFLTTHWGTYEVVEGKNSKIALKPWTEDSITCSYKSCGIRFNRSRSG